MRIQDLAIKNKVYMRPFGIGVHIGFTRAHMEAQGRPRLSGPSIHRPIHLSARPPVCPLGG